MWLYFIIIMRILNSSPLILPISVSIKYILSRKYFCSSNFVGHLYITY
nr:MAG TPA: hypothetical protein [Caudoviricetes sp.]